MLTGSVLPDGQSTIAIRVRGPTGKIANVQGIIDTGFNDFLSLPMRAIAHLELILEDEVKYFLADGSETTIQSYLAEVDWMGVWRIILVIPLDANALVGTRMLQGCLLTIEMVDGGRVQIQPLAS